MKVGLREKKISQNKIKILNAFTLKILSGIKFSDISTKEVCSEVEISEATFYNYFPHKQDLLFFLINLWLLRLFAEVEQNHGDIKGTKYIREFFATIIDYMRDDHNVLLEAIQFVDPKSGEGPAVTISEYELSLAFEEDYEQVLKFRETNIHQMIAQHLKIAQDDGEIAADIDLGLATASVLGVLIRGPILSKGQAGGSSKDFIRFNLELVLNGLKMGIS